MMRQAVTDKVFISWFQSFDQRCITYGGILAKHIRWYSSLLNFWNGGQVDATGIEGHHRLGNSFIALIKQTTVKMLLDIALELYLVELIAQTVVAEVKLVPQTVVSEVLATAVEEGGIIILIHLIFTI